MITTNDKWQTTNKFKGKTVSSGYYTVSDVSKIANGKHVQEEWWKSNDKQVKLEKNKSGKAMRFNCTKEEKWIYILLSV